MPGIPFALLAGVLTAIVLIVVLPGGLVSVVRSDVVTFIATLVLLPLLLVLGASRSAAQGGLGTVFAADQFTVAPFAQWTHPALPFWFVTSLIVLTCFTYIAAPWYGQKMFAARDARTAVTAAGLSAVLVFLLYGSMVLGAAHLRVVVPGLPDPQLAVPTMILHWLPAAARGGGLAVLFAAALTTLGGVWSAMTAMVAADFGWSGARGVRTQRVLLGVAATVSWLGAILLV